MFISSVSGASVFEKLHSDTAISDYKKNLLSKVQSGGTLYCGDRENGKHIEFKSCQSYVSLIKQGCFSQSKSEMIFNSSYPEICSEIKALKNASVSKINYFDLNSSDWWEPIPAEVIPMPGGLYTDSSWEHAELQRNKLVTGKLLRDLKLVNDSKELGVLNATLSKVNDECGEIDDTFIISVKLLADFDRDGIAELLLKGSRLNTSVGCSLGSGNRIGAEFTVLLKKISHNETPIILPYPLVEK